MRSVHHNGINACFNQSLNSRLGAFAYPHCGSHQQTARCISRSQRKIELLGNVFNSDQAFKLKSFIDHQQSLQLVLVQQRFGFFRGGAFGHRDQAVTLGHDFADRLVIAGFETHVTSRHNAYNFAAFTNRKARDPQLI